MSSSRHVELVTMPSAASPPAGQQRVAGLDTSQVSVDVGGSIDSVRGEIDDAFKDMATFLNRQPDEIMRMCGGHSARMAELRVRIQRVEDFQRQWRSVRTREIEPLQAELGNQYQIASRLQSCLELDWKMESGSR